MAVGIRGACHIEAFAPFQLELVLPCVRTSSRQSRAQSHAIEHVVLDPPAILSAAYRICMRIREMFSTITMVASLRSP